MNEDLSSFLAGHPLTLEFIRQLNGKKFSDINQYVAEFQTYCEGKQIPNFDNELWFKILQEKIALFKAKNKTEFYQIGDKERLYITLGQFNPYLKLEEYDLEDFIEEWESRRTGQRKYTDEQSQRYKSYRESWLYEVYTYDKAFLEKYKHAAHPLIQSTIGKALIAGGEQRGIGYLFNALTKAVVIPNIYWHNERAIIGYIESIWEIIRLSKLAHISGNEKGIDEPLIFCKLLRLLFLYMSRYIELNPDKIKTADVYSNRAELFYFFPTEMKSLFMDSEFFFVIPDLQFSSDKFLAYRTASQTCPELVSGFYKQCLRDSKKMYQYGNLNYPTIDGGYTVIEDAGWMEIIEICKMRSRVVAQQIYNQDSQGYIYLTKEQIEYLFSHILTAGVDLHKDMKDLHDN
ncbi:hypothetical protein [uncultured Prevotella sp.]|uniref:hypothetical protein n=1 Tax=uncultured Prevotella sp. TaxID=159272 RepID=UPI00261D292F|nr:hypothetical protein [uncultured Prevotella sp.]